MLMYSVFLLPAIRGQQITEETGGRLKDTCSSNPPDWPTIMDQAMPEALTVKQSAPSRSWARSEPQGRVVAEYARLAASLVVTYLLW